MTEVRDVTRKFFQLPDEEKLKIKMTPQSGYRCGFLNIHLVSLICSSLFGPFSKDKLCIGFIVRGYQRVGENVTKGKPDMHEAIDVSLPLLESSSHACLGCSKLLNHVNKYGSATRLSNRVNMEILLNQWKDLICGMFPSFRFCYLFSRHIL